MLSLTVICVGKCKERFYKDAASEYEKRLNAFCRINIREICERRLPESPSEAEISIALKREAEEIRAALPQGAHVTALCVEGRELTSGEIAGVFKARKAKGVSKMCFIIGGSFGLDEGIKASADDRLSMSKMTLPHHLARVVLLEQIYRAFSIEAGLKYHK